MTTAIYARISDDRKDGVGVENQLQMCRAWCAAEGWGPAVEYVDNDVSASVYARKPRLGYRALLRAVEAGEVDRIVVFNTDRLFRQVRELEVLIPMAAKVEVRSKVGGVINLSTAGGRANARQQTTWASYESEVKSERVILAQTTARAKGEPHGGPRPFGWLAIAEGDRNGGRSWDPRQHDPAEAALIRQAVDDVLAGEGVTSIARAWNAAKVPQVRGKQGWSATTVVSMLRSPRNAGLSIHNGVVTPGDWQAIIDPQKWERVCFELKRRGQRFTVGRRRRSLLSGVLICGVCRTPLTHGRTRTTECYRCKAGPGCAGCGRIQIGADQLEEYVVDALFTYADSGELRAALASRDDGRVLELRAELAALDVSEHELVAAFEGDGNAPALRMASDGIKAKRSALNQELGTVSARSPLEQYQTEGALRKAWPSRTPDQRRAAIAAAFGSITVNPSSSRGRPLDASRVVFGRTGLAT